MVVAGVWGRVCECGEVERDREARLFSAVTEGQHGRQGEKHKTCMWT